MIDRIKVGRRMSRVRRERLQIYSSCHSIGAAHDDTAAARLRYINCKLSGGLGFGQTRREYHRASDGWGL